MRNCRSLLIAVLSTGLLSACGTSPPVRYYGLEPMAMPPAGELALVTVGIGPIRFPDYLKQPQIVTRTQGARLEIAEFDRWAEPLESAFPRTLALNLDGLLDGVMVIEYPFARAFVEADYRIIGQVVRFEVDDAGAAVLDVQWGMTRGDGEPVAKARRSRYRSAASDPGDYDSLVAALNETVTELSREMADAYRKVVVD